MTIDRRDFMKCGALSTLALAVDKKTALADQDAPVKPMASQAKPITREEYLQRQETARRYMQDAGIDALFLTGGTSLQYFTNAQWGLSERLFALVFPAKGDLAWVAPAFERGRALEQIKFGNDVRTWQEDESPSFNSQRSRGRVGQAGCRRNRSFCVLRRCSESRACAKAHER